MMRPLPPFRVKPLKETTVRRAAAVTAEGEAADATPVSVKASRLPIKVTRPAGKPQLKVLRKH